MRPPLDTIFSDLKSVVIRRVNTSWTDECTIVFFVYLYIVLYLCVQGVSVHVRVSVRHLTKLRRHRKVDLHDVSVFVERFRIVQLCKRV